MRVLMAEDDTVSRRMLEATLNRLDYDVIAVADGAEAWTELQKSDAPRLVILDWMMPEIDGVEVCKRIRDVEDSAYKYIIILTARDQQKDIVEGLDSGADDYLTKPFDPQELRSRMRTGERILQLESDLAGKVEELQAALDHVKTLQGLLPICMHCKKIRDEGAVWHRIENYISDHSSAMFTHSLCEECLKKHYPQHSK